MILIIESYSELAEIMATYFRSQGFRAQGVSTHEEAIQIAKGFKISALIMESKMNNIGHDSDGKSLAAAILKLHPEAQVILTTNQLPSVTSKDGLPASTEVLAKPFTPAELIEKFKRNKRPALKVA